MSELVNAYRNEETLSNQLLTDPDISNSIDLAQESCCFGNQDSISSHPFELDQNQNFENHLDILASYPFSEIELENECVPKSQLGNSISLLDSILTPVYLPDFNHFSKSVLNPVLIHHEIESPIFQDQHIELDQYHTFESSIDKLASFHFDEIKLKQECDPDPPFYASIPNFESIVTLVLLHNLTDIFESVLIPMPVILELELPIMQSHNPLRENEFLDLDPIFEPISTPKPLVDFNQFSKSVLVPVSPKANHNFIISYSILG